MISNNPYAPGGWYNPQNPLSINRGGHSMFPNAPPSTTYGATALEYLTTQHRPEFIVLISNLNNEPSLEDASSDHGSKDLRVVKHRPEPSHRMSAMFQGCEALEFNNCHITYSGRDYNRSGMHCSRPGCLHAQIIS
ncbi:hypothetical protein BKA70DRAFT_1569592 [Coprinopsis sp. MPI-PUGE-AT-0042]|nr:hypothetical protein BKA70DRAFT_1569592 [Coprinopsis sp. MPI-PUGE-AT-0042]